MEDMNIAPEISKEEKEKLLNAKMDAIRRKNEELRKRYEEIEADKKLADKYSASVQMEHVRPYVMKPHRPRPEKIYPVSDQDSVNDESSMSSSAQEMLLARQRLSQNEGPPPDPSYRFLADPDRDGSENTEDHQSAEGDSGRRGRGGRGRERGEGAFEERRGRGGGGFDNEKGRFSGEHEENGRGRGSGRRYEDNARGRGGVGYEDNGRGRGGGFEGRNRERGGYNGRSRGWEERGRGRGRGWDDRGRGRCNNFRGNRGPVQEGGHRGSDASEEDCYEENERGRGHHQRRGRAQRRQPGGRGQHRAYEQWKAERAAIDDERISRARSGDGEWRREWDLQKIDQEKQSVDEPVDYDPRYPRSKVEGFKLKDMLTEEDMKKLEEIKIEKEEFMGPQVRGKGRGNIRTRGSGRRGGNDRPQFNTHSVPVRNQDNWREVDQNLSGIPPFQQQEVEEEKVQSTYFEKRRLPDRPCNFEEGSADGATTTDSKSKFQHKKETNKGRKKIFRDKKTSKVTTALSPESFGQSTRTQLPEVNGHNEDQLFERYSCEEILRESSPDHEGNLQTEIGLAPDTICYTHDANESFNNGNLSLSLEPTINVNEVYTLNELNDENYSVRHITEDSLNLNSSIAHHVNLNVDSIPFSPEIHKEVKLEDPICDANFEKSQEYINLNLDISNASLSDESTEIKMLHESKQESDEILDHNIVSVRNDINEYRPIEIGENVVVKSYQENVLFKEEEKVHDTEKSEECSIDNPVDVLDNSHEKESCNESVAVEKTVLNDPAGKEIVKNVSLNDLSQLETKTENNTIVEGNLSKPIEGSLYDDCHQTSLDCQDKKAECNKAALLVSDNVENVIDLLQPDCDKSELSFEPCNEISLKGVVNIQNEAIPVKEIINSPEDFPISLESVKNTIGSVLPSESNVNVSKSDIEETNVAASSVGSLKTLESTASITPNATVIDRKLSSEKEIPKKISSPTKNSSPSLNRVSSTKPVSKVIAKTPIAAPKVKLSPVKSPNLGVVKTTTPSSLTKKILPKTIPAKIPTKSTIDSKPSIKLPVQPKSTRDLKSPTGSLKTTKLETSALKRPKSNVAAPVGSNLMEGKIPEEPSSSNHKVLCSNMSKVSGMTTKDTELTATIDSVVCDLKATSITGCEVVPTNNLEVSSGYVSEIPTTSDLKIPQSVDTTNPAVNNSINDIISTSDLMPSSTSSISTDIDHESLGSPKVMNSPTPENFSINSANFSEVSQAEESISICIETQTINPETLASNVHKSAARTEQTKLPSNDEVNFKEVTQTEGTVSCGYSGMLETLQPFEKSPEANVPEISLSDVCSENSFNVALSPIIETENPALRASEAVNGSISEQTLLPTSDQIISVANDKNIIFEANQSQSEVSVKDSFEESPTTEFKTSDKIIYEDNLKHQPELTQLATDVHIISAVNVHEADEVTSLAASKYNDEITTTNVSEVSQFEASNSTVSEVGLPLTIDQITDKGSISVAGNDSCSEATLIIDQKTSDNEGSISTASKTVISDVSLTIPAIPTENIPEVSQSEVTKTTSLIVDEKISSQISQIETSGGTSSEFENSCDPKVCLESVPIALPDVPVSISMDPEIHVSSSDVSEVIAAATSGLESI